MSEKIKVTLTVDTNIECEIHKEPSYVIVNAFFSIVNGELDVHDIETSCGDCT